jgi:hypothetical protein
MEIQLKQFNIYHPVGGNMNHECSLEGYTYEFIGSIKSENLVRSFYLSQNNFNPAYAKLGKRSTSVGDIVSDGKTVHMYQSMGTKKVSSKETLYTMIMELEKNVVDILSIPPLDDETMDQLLDNCYE